MGLERILVHYDNTKRSERALATALELAQAGDAHLIGCAVEAEPIQPTYYAAALIPADVPADFLDGLVQAQRAAVAAARCAFDKATAAAGRSGRSEFSVGRGDAIRVLARAGRGCDLIVLGQAEPGTEPLDIEKLPDNLVLEAGRPILVVPYIGQRKPVGRDVLLCWTDSPEAARAMADALPVLTAASKVTVLTAGADAPENDLVGDPAARFFAAHGIDVELRRAAAAGIDDGTAILNEAAETGADLIVMGAYGHSRLRESILGGATRTVLREMTAPVLMSH